jgi:hypothetical protein
MFLDVEKNANRKEQDVGGGEWNRLWQRAYFLFWDETILLCGLHILADTVKVTADPRRMVIA